MNIFQEIQLLEKLQGPLTALQGVFKMTLSINMIIQLLGVIVQIVDATGSIVPHKYQVLVIGIVSGLQGIFAALAHFYNTDGTSQKAANDKGTVR